MPRGTCPDKEACMQTCADDRFCGAINFGSGDCRIFGWMEGKPYSTVQPHSNPHVNCYVKTSANDKDLIPVDSGLDVQDGALPGFINVGKGMCKSEDGEYLQPVPSGLLASVEAPLAAINCQQKCADEDSCQAINFFNGTCFLFGKLDSKFYAKSDPTLNSQYDCWIQWTTVKAGRAAIDGFQGVGMGICKSDDDWFFDMDVQAGDKDVQDPENSWSDKDLCMQSCAEDDVCGGFIWKDSGTCFWFEKLQGRPYVKTKPDWDCNSYCFAKIFPKANVSDVLPGFQRVGQGRCETGDEQFLDLGYAMEAGTCPGSRACQQACLQDDSCAAINYANGDCIFFGRIKNASYTKANHEANSQSQCYVDVQINRTAKIGAHSGFRGRGYGLCVSVDQEFLDPDYGMPQGTCPNADVCMQKCAEDSSCGAINWGENGDCLFYPAMDGKLYAMVKPDSNPQYYCFSKL
mmetsp:Transcript_102351/g.196410  ORF Transcript_102351/g.196410 Transcript_102351/m.196410 type:complete len:461 (+) Transcript_102351:232-1614(+)